MLRINRLKNTGDEGMNKLKQAINKLILISNITKT